MFSDFLKGMTCFHWGKKNQASSPSGCRDRPFYCKSTCLVCCAARKMDTVLNQWNAIPSSFILWICTQCSTALTILLPTCSPCDRALNHLPQEVEWSQLSSSSKHHASVIRLARPKLMVLCIYFYHLENGKCKHFIYIFTCLFFNSIFHIHSLSISINLAVTVPHGHVQTIICPSGESVKLTINTQHPMKPPGSLDPNCS